MLQAETCRTFCEMLEKLQLKKEFEVSEIERSDVTTGFDNFFGNIQIIFFNFCFEKRLFVVYPFMDMLNVAASKKTILFALTF